MRITVPEYLILFGLGVLNVWAALILASVRARDDDQRMPVLEIAAPGIDLASNRSRNEVQA